MSVGVLPLTYFSWVIKPLTTHIGPRVIETTFTGRSRPPADQRRITSALITLSLTGRSASQYSIPSSLYHGSNADLSPILIAPGQGFAEFDIEQHLGYLSALGVSSLPCRSK